MASEDGRKILQITKGGPTHHGQSVRYDLEFDGGGTESFHCAYEALPKIVEALRNAGAVTEKFRREMLVPPLEAILPHRAVEVRAGHDPHTKEIGVQFSTEDGFPVTVSMPPTLAEKTIEHLKVALARSKSGSDRRS